MTIVCTDRLIALNDVIKLCSPSVAPDRATTPQVNWSVVNKVPDKPTYQSILCLICDRGLDDLLLHSGNARPGDHEARIFLPVGPSHETSIVRANGGGKHACAPWPVHVVKSDGLTTAVQLGIVENDLVHLLHVGACNHS